MDEKKYRPIPGNPSPRFDPDEAVEWDKVVVDREPIVDENELLDMTEAFVKELIDTDATILGRLRHDVHDEVEGAFGRVYGDVSLDEAGIVSGRFEYRSPGSQVPKNGGTITGRLNNLDPEPQDIQRYGRGFRIAAIAGHGAYITAALIAAMDEMHRNDRMAPPRMLSPEEMDEMRHRRMPVEDLRPIYIREDAPAGSGEGRHYYGRTGRAAIVGKNRDKAKKARKARRKNR